MSDRPKLSPCPRTKGYGDNYNHRDLVWNIEGLLRTVQQQQALIEGLQTALIGLKDTVRLQDDVIESLLAMHGTEATMRLHYPYGSPETFRGAPINKEVDERIDKLEERLDNISRSVYGPNSNDD